MRDIVERLKLQAFVADKTQSGMKPLMLDCLGEIIRLRAENERLRKALNAILNDVGYHNPMRMTTEISDKILEDAVGALNDNI